MPTPRKGSVLVLVGTRKGAFLLSSDARRRSWRVDGPHFPGRNVHHFILDSRDSETLFATIYTEWWGSDVQRSATGDAPGRALKAASVIRRTPASPSSVSGTSAPAAMPNPVSSIVEWTPQDFSAAKTAASHGTKSKASIAIPRASAGRPALAA